MYRPMTWRRLLRARQKLAEILFPELCPGVCAMSVRFEGLGHQSETRARHSFQRELRNRKIAWVDEIIGRVDPRKGDPDLFEGGPGIIGTRRVKLVDEIVRIKRLDRVRNTLLGVGARGLPRWILRLVQKRRRSRHKEQIFR